jgi:uncharacterized surface protein with fasciclin (FAS1) repeats
VGDTKENLMRHIRIATVAAVAVAALSLSACGSSDTATPETPVATSAPAAAATPTDSPTAAAAGTIVETASSNPDFSTLVAAVKAAGLVETLNGTGPFTVFAPTDEAFAALPKGVLDKLLQPANKETLTKILTYHVIPAKVMAADVKAGEVKTVEGSEITIATDSGVKVNKATVTATDVEASNGVIHVIDQVLLPADVNPGEL